MVKIAICDDNTLELEKTTSLVKKWADCRGIEVAIEAYDNGDSLLTNQKKRPAHIILLDIMMPLFNGMETAKELRKADGTSIIVFLTSSPEYAIESYDVKARGYLLKPINEEKLISVLDDCVNEIDAEKENIVVKTSIGYQKIYLEKIEYVEAQNRKSVIVLNDGSLIEVVETFSNTAEKFTGEEVFFQCHRSYLVSMGNVDRFNSTEIITKCGKHIPIARGYAKPFKDAYFTYMFKKGKG